MSEALLSGIAAIVVCLINGAFQIRQVRKENDKTIALIEYKLDELTKRVDKHNNVIERTYKLEELTALQEEKISEVKRRVEDLEDDK